MPKSKPKATIVFRLNGTLAEFQRMATKIYGNPVYGFAAHIGSSAWATEAAALVNFSRSIVVREGNKITYIKGRPRK